MYTSEVKPGIHPHFVNKSFSQQEMKIISKLSKEWFVTHAGGSIRLGSTSGYSYFLMKPTSFYQEMFNLEREIVVVFSPYSNFEARTLDAISTAIEKASEINGDLRIEKICSVLFSMDPNCENKIKDLLKNDQESQIIIALNYDDFVDTTDVHYLENKFRRNFYTRDLFAFESPLKKDLYFFGRTDIIHKIVNRHRSNENSALFGLRKTGKTSLILKIERTLEKNDEKCILIDCQNTSFHQRRWHETLYYIISLIRNKYKNDIDNYCESIGAGKLKFRSEESYTEKDASLIFEEEIRKLYRAFNNKGILLIFDEIERVTFELGESEHWSKGMDFIYFWQSLRSIFQKTDGVFSYLIVGTNALCIERALINGKDNPLFNSVPFNYIERFDTSQTKEMVTKLGSYLGLQFEESIFYRLTEDFGGHPFLIRHVCSLINSMVPIQRPHKVDRKLYENAKEEFKIRATSYFEMMLGVLQDYYPDELAMLEYLALEDVETFNNFVLAWPHYTNHLIGYGIIAKIHNGYDFKIDVIKEYLESKNKYKKINQSIEERFSEIQERRHKLETKLRDLIKTTLKIRFGDIEAKKMVVAKFPSEIRESIASLTHSELLNANKNKYLNYLQLKEIISGNWDEFKNVFQRDKTSFEYKMNIVNSLGRSDTHSKNVTAKDMEEFRVAISWLEDNISEISK